MIKTFLDFVVYVDKSLSRSQARRLVLEGAIELNGKKIKNPNAKVIWTD